MTLDALSEPEQPVPLDEAQVRAIVLAALTALNQSREAQSQVMVAADAPVFGPDSPLDSLGLVSLLFDIEERLATHGCYVVLSDDRAMSQVRSPFRSVPSLVDYICSVAQG